MRDRDREPTRAQLVGGACLSSAHGWASPVSSDSFDLKRRECGTAPQCLPRSKRGDSAERRRAVSDDVWLVDDDDAACDSPTLYLAEATSHRALLSDFVADRAAPSPPAVDRPLGAFCAPTQGGGESSNSSPRAGERPPERGGQRLGANMQRLEEESRSRVEGRMNLSPRGERGEGGGAYSPSFKGAALDVRLSAGEGGASPHHHAAYNLRLQIPPFSDGDGDKYEEMLRERPPSRQRNLPMHLNSDITLQKQSNDGQLSPDLERKWAHFSKTPRPLSRHKSPPEAVFLDLPPEALTGDCDPQPHPPDLTDRLQPDDEIAALALSDPPPLTAACGLTTHPRAASSSPRSGAAEPSGGRRDSSAARRLSSPGGGAAPLACVSASGTPFGEARQADVEDPPVRDCTPPPPPFRVIGMHAAPTSPASKGPTIVRPSPLSSRATGMLTGADSLAASNSNLFGIISTRPTSRELPTSRETDGEGSSSPCLDEWLTTCETKQQAKAKKLNRLSAMYGGSSTMSNACPMLAGGPIGVQPSSRLVPHPSATLAAQKRGGRQQPRGAPSGAPPAAAASRAGGAHDPASVGHAAAARLDTSHLTRCPHSRSTLRSASSELRSKEDGSSRRVTSADRFEQSKRATATERTAEPGSQDDVASPLPFESSLAPDFLALFANWEAPWQK